MLEVDDVYFCLNFYKINLLFPLEQEVGSIIGKKGDNIKRFREEVKEYYLAFVL